jgi:hypothetical protein
LAPIADQEQKKEKSHNEKNELVVVDFITRKLLFNVRLVVVVTSLFVDFEDSS